MYQPEIRPDAMQAPPGLRCPSCGATTKKLGTDARDRQVVTCASCGTFLRLLRRQGDPEPGFEPRPAGTSEYAYDAPPAGSWWLGYVKGLDGIVRPVALPRPWARPGTARSRARCVASSSWPRPTRTHVRRRWPTKG
jgi:hypothetical protein